MNIWACSGPQHNLTFVRFSTFYQHHPRLVQLSMWSFEVTEVVPPNTANSRLIYTEPLIFSLEPSTLWKKQTIALIRWHHRNDQQADQFNAVILRPIGILNHDLLCLARSASCFALYSSCAFNNFSDHSSTMEAYFTSSSWKSLKWSSIHHRILPIPPGKLFLLFSPTKKSQSGKWFSGKGDLKSPAISKYRYLRHWPTWGFSSHTFFSFSANSSDAISMERFFAWKTSLSFFNSSSNLL